MEIKEVIRKLDEKYPMALQENWDNSGLQVGDYNREVTNIMISLDLEFETIEEAIKNKCNLIINHHPLLFSGLKTIDLNSPIGKKIEMLIKNDIALFAMHTNLDSAKGGVNDNLCKILEIKETNVLEVSEESSMARYGYVEEQKAEKFADFVKTRLEAEAVILYGNPDKLVKKIAVCGGAGASFLDDAVARKCDLMITGDIKYHESMDYPEKGLIIIDPGHYASENHIVKELKHVLEKLTRSKIFTYSKRDSFRKII